MARTAKFDLAAFSTPDVEPFFVVSFVPSVSVSPAVLVCSSLLSEFSVACGCVCSSVSVCSPASVCPACPSLDSSVVWAKRIKYIISKLMCRIL